MIVDLRPRPLPIRLWRSYRNYRELFGPWDSLRAAIQLNWLYWKCIRADKQRADRLRAAIERAKGRP